MSNFVKSIRGLFTIKLNDVEYPNLVVNSGLSNIFKEGSIASLCETLKVFNDESEVEPGDTDYVSPVASSSNITDTVYGVSGDGISDYFYMRRTWLFTRGQIQGIINKLAVYSDDGTLYAAALLKNEAGELDPVRPLFAPKVEITYESRWHFKEGDNYNIGTPVYFSDAGMVVVKTNMASKNDETTFSKMNEPFRILGVELFSDSITSDASVPTQSLGVVDVADYTVTYIDGEFGVYGQKLNLVLPKDKYINDAPIAAMVVTTTRGKWQVGFEAALEKPTLSKREITINIPFIHGTVSLDGDVVPGGNPDAIDSIFSTLIHSTYSVSTRNMTYDDVGVLSGDVTGYFGAVKDTTATLTITIPEDGTVVVAMGASADLNTYLDGSVEGILLEMTNVDTLKGSVEGAPIDFIDMEFNLGDVVTVSVVDGVAMIDNSTQGTSYSTDTASTFVSVPDVTLVGVKDVATGSTLTVY